MRKIISLIILITICFLTSNYVAAQKVNWLSFDQLNENIRKEPKPILIFIHTDWCKFCMMQENTTFKKREVIESLNKNYYCLKLNAEDQDAITFLNRTYDFQSSGYHQLATFLGKENGQLTFPTTVMLSKYLQVTNRQVGYLDHKTLMSLVAANTP